MFRTAAAALAAALLSAPAAAWIVAGPVFNGAIDIFTMDNTGAKGKDVVSVPVTPGEETAPNAFACGRCFCLLVTNDAAAHRSYLYNISFCLVPVPAVESKTPFPGVAFNLHSNLGEGDGGAGWALVLESQATPPTWRIVEAAGGTVRTVLDITSFVANSNGEPGFVYAGGTAFCADSATMWVAVDAPGGDKDTLLTVDLNARKVTSTLSLNNPVLAAHFGNCKASPQLPGGTMLQSSGPGRHALVYGFITPDGGFEPADAASVPAGTQLDASPLAAFIDETAFGSPVGALLYTNGGLPGALFVSTPNSGRGDATVVDVDFIVTGIAMEY
jgi:hypothetical protein